MNKYIKLARLHSIAPIHLVALPSIWYVILSFKEYTQLLWIILIVVGATLARSAGVIINDIIDRDIDHLVSRTKDRPLTNKSVSLYVAITLVIAILLIIFALILAFNIEILPFAVLILVFIVIYPFSKRFFIFPQIILGFVYNSGLLLVAIIIPSNNILQPIILYIGSVFWTIMYDTVYGHQDKDDDKKIKMYSMANSKLGTKKWLKNFSLVSFILINLANISYSGNIVSILLLVIIEYFNSKEITKLDINNHLACNKFFKYQVKIGYFVLGAMIIGRF